MVTYLDPNSSLNDIEMIRSTCPNELNNSIELMRYTFSWEVLLCSKISAQTRTQIRYDLAHEPDTCSLSLSLSLFHPYVISAFRFGCSRKLIDFGARFLPIYGHVFDRFWLCLLSVRRWFVAPIWLFKRKSFPIDDNEIYTGYIMNIRYYRK